MTCLVDLASRRGCGASSTAASQAQASTSAGASTAVHSGPQRQSTATACGASYTPEATASFFLGHGDLANGEGGPMPKGLRGFRLGSRLTGWTPSPQRS